jgi:hypothetical protein
MTQYLISFDDGDMQIPDEEFADVVRSTMAVYDDALAAGVWVFGGGLTDAQQATVVTVDGEVREGPVAGKQNHIGGFCVIDVPSRDDALRWAAKFAAACRCAQEVREFVPEPQV